MSKKGEYIRQDSSFRNRITTDRATDGCTGFKAEDHRYHLYVSLGCPWAHRTLIVRKLKGLESVITVDVVDWLLGKEGWKFTDQKPMTTLDTVNNCTFISQIYEMSDPSYNGAWSVPVLFDKITKRIVNNESSEIIRMLNSEFNEFCETEEQKKLDLYPEELRDEIENVNDWIYRDINNGVYRCGFATSQGSYDSAVLTLFEALDKVEDILSKSRYLTGNRLTEADIRLFTTLVRFDLVYHGHFKCNKKRIIDYPNIWAFARDIYQTDGVASTVNFEHIKKLYEEGQRKINPLGIVSIGPDLDFLTPHNRHVLHATKVTTKK